MRSFLKDGKLYLEFASEREADQAQYDIFCAAAQADNSNDEELAERLRDLAYEVCW